MCLEDRPWRAASSRPVFVSSIGFGVGLTAEASANVSVSDKEMNLTNDNGVKIYIN